jgi:hypothetical protein
MHPQKVDLFISSTGFYLLNHGMEDANDASIPIWMGTFAVLILICKNHHIRLGANVDRVLVSSTIIHHKVDSQSFMAKDLIVVNQKLLSVTVSEAITWNFGYSPKEMIFQSGKKILRLKALSMYLNSSKYKKYQDSMVTLIIGKPLCDVEIDFA